MKQLLNILAIIACYIGLALAFVPMLLIFTIMKMSGHTRQSYKNYILDWFVPSAYR